MTIRSVCFAIALGTITTVATTAVATWPATAGDINKSTHLSNTGQSKVNSVKAKQYLQSDGEEDGYERSDDTIVNFGSKKKGTCNMNVGGTPSGSKDKDVVVTAKNIINICK